MNEDFDRLADALETRMKTGGLHAWGEEEFSARALEVFAHQYGVCDPYRAFCDARGASPAVVDDWRDVPLVPATAFKYFDFVSSGRPIEAVFRTSGTTRGSKARGRHCVPRTSLYTASLLRPLKRALLPDVEEIRFVSLIPSPAVAPDSSLSFMVGAAADRYASEIDWLVDASGSWSDEAAAVWDSIAEAGAPVLLLTTALALVHALERSDQGGTGLVPLPEGSRIMETGGFKGARREVPRSELYRRASGRVRVPVERIVNEYGMTELLSQLWEPVLTEGGSASGWHVPPPWLRVRALDPATLRPLPDGDDGVLAFFDLANLGSVSHVLTEDIGCVREGRVRLRGRAPGSEPRGCSRAMDELMSAAGR
jgi:hypothetical protein